MAFHWRGGLQSGALVSLLLICAAASFAQDLGEIARQERARKKEQPDRAAYVYTNDDLHREHILVPEDRARVLAAREAASKPATQVAQSPAAGAPAANASSARATTLAPTAAQTISASAVSPQPSSTPTAATTTTTTASVPVPTTSNSNDSSVSQQFSKPAQFASPKVAMAEQQSSPLEAILELVHEQEVSAREAAAQKRAARHRATPSALIDIPFSGDREPQPSRQAEWAPEEKKKTVRREGAAEVPAPVPPTVRRHAAARAEPVDLGVTDIVTVEPGDSLWKLARLYLGSGRRWRELAALNTQILNANLLHVGEWICLPTGHLQNARGIAPRARSPASVTQRVAQKIAPKVCPGEVSFDRFVVTAEPLGGSGWRALSPGRCMSTP